VKYNSKEELLVLMAIQELGEASITEIEEYIEKHWKQLTDSEPKLIPQDTLLRYVRRWNKRKAVSSNIVNGELCYSLADIPWYPKNQIIRCLKAPSEEQAKSFIDAYETKLKERKSIRTPQSVYRDYKQFTVTMTTVDNVAGGLPNGERKLKFPRNQKGKLYIPINWLKGWMRENSALGNLPQSVFVYKTGFSTGQFQKQPKTKHVQTKVKTGLTEYEYIGPGETFSFTMNYPMHGTAVKTLKQLEQFLSMLEHAPIRGLGAYPARFGGRIKLQQLTASN
jgi:hypothetical protein